MSEAVRLSVEGGIYRIVALFIHYLTDFRLALNFLRVLKVKHSREHLELKLLRCKLELD
jgi:hypothetical protein